MRRRLIAMLLIVATLLTPRFAAAQQASATPQAQLAKLNERVSAALAALSQGDIAKARAEFKAFNNGWFEIEDGIRNTSREQYRSLETAIGDAGFALKQEPVDVAKATAALQALDTANKAFIGAAGTNAEDSAEPASGTTLGNELGKLDEALAAIAKGDLQYALTEVEDFRNTWPDVEAAVAANGAVYTRAEELPAQAVAQLKAGQAQAAATTLTQLKSDLQPFASATLSYGIFDAMIILLREGLEALLIIAALLAFLQKSGNADKQRWIWAGGAAGVAASMLTAVAVQLLFRSLVNGTNQALVEGITGLVAAIMLFYVSYWMHSKTHLGGWQRYLKDKTSAALATGSLFSLAALAFLSVFREGAEATIFYMGIAPSIALRDLLLGLSIGAVLLTIIGTAVIGLGKRIPLKPFFQVTSLLIWYLGFKFVGVGIRTLQTAGIVPETSITWLPRSDLLGIYPTLQTILPQLLLIVIAVAVVVWTRAAARQAALQSTTANV